MLLTMKYLPMIIKWLAVLQKNGADQTLISKLIDLKQLVQRCLKDLDLLDIHRVGGGSGIVYLLLCT